MRLITRSLTVLASNGVIIWGVGIAEWTGATALVLYWFETLMSSLFISLRIAMHRAFTGKRGHFRSQLGLRVASGGRGEMVETQVTSFFVEFLAASMVFTLAHGVFLVAFLAMVFKSAPAQGDFWYGAAAIGSVQFGGFLLDLFGIKSRPFSWIKGLAQAALGRVVLIHLAIIGGVAFTAASGRNMWFFLPFAGLKVLVEVGSVFGQDQRVQRAPAWLVWLMKRLKPDLDFAAFIAQENAKELAREAADEQTIGLPRLQS